MMFIPLAYAQETRELNNPFGDVTIMGILAELINVLLIFSVPIIMFFLIFAGFQYVTAQGNPEKIRSASRALMYGLIGGTIIFGSWAITAIIQTTVNAF